MRIEVNNEQDLNKYISKVENLVNETGSLEWEKYITLGSKTVRVLGYSNEFLSYAERQLTYTLKDNAENYDATLVLFKVLKADIQKLHEDFLSTVPAHRLRLEKILSGGSLGSDSRIINSSKKDKTLAIEVNPRTGFINVYDSPSNTYYYGVNDLSPEEFIKTGHVFVQFFNKITSEDNTALVHGAAVGLDGEGVLFCARGQRGKSTLSVLSMMEGFEYVSDDYLILEKDGDKLYTDPIYSIITLSPTMYNKLFDKLEGSRFISNNGRKDKYIINIANYHNQFKTKYPIKFCMFPEIVSDKEPSIVACPKGRAICQLVQSTVIQLQDISNHEVIKKIVDMVKDYEFFQINLCKDIDKNTKCLREFMKNYENRPKETFIEDKIYEDMVFNVTHILDSERYVISYLNEFATIIYKNLKNGIDKNTLISKLEEIEGMPLDIKDSVEALVKALLDKNVLKTVHNSQDIDIDIDLIKKSNFELVFKEFLSTGVRNLVIDYKKEN